jgi:outer membrane receptor protein involved in Fe transport
MQFLINDKLSLKASYVEMQQNIHLLTNTTVGMPTDLWVPATPMAKPEKSWQAALGLTYLPSDLYLVTVESYYKSMTNLIEYENGASFMNVDKDWQTKIETGSGRAYGAELFVKKNAGRMTGWVGYTLSWANRTFQNIDGGETFPFKYDRRHDLETAVFYKLKEKINLSFTWSFGSGYPVSIPVAKYPNHQGANFGNSQGDELIYHYPSRNNYRMRTFHRLDAMISFSKKKRWGEREWVIGFYNAYNRKNPFYVAMEHEQRIEGQGSVAARTKIVQYSLFPVIPSVSYNFKF